MAEALEAADTEAASVEDTEVALEVDTAVGAADSITAPEALGAEDAFSFRSIWAAGA